MYSSRQNAVSQSNQLKFSQQLDDFKYPKLSSAGLGISVDQLEFYKHLQQQQLLLAGSSPAASQLPSFPTGLPPSLGPPLPTTTASTMLNNNSSGNGNPSICLASTGCNNTLGVGANSLLPMQGPGGGTGMLSNPFAPPLTSVSGSAALTSTTPSAGGANTGLGFLGLPSSVNPSASSPNPAFLAGLAQSHPAMAAAMAAVAAAGFPPPTGASSNSSSVNNSLGVSSLPNISMSSFGFASQQSNSNLLTSTGTYSTPLPPVNSTSALGNNLPGPCSVPPGGPMPLTHPLPSIMSPAALSAIMNDKSLDEKQRTAAAMAAAMTAAAAAHQANPSGAGGGGGASGGGGGGGSNPMSLPGGAAAASPFAAMALDPAGFMATMATLAQSAAGFDFSTAAYAAAAAAAAANSGFPPPTGVMLPGGTSGAGAADFNPLMAAAAAAAVAANCSSADQPPPPPPPPPGILALTQNAAVGAYSGATSTATSGGPLNSPGLNHAANVISPAPPTVGGGRSSCRSPLSSSGVSESKRSRSDRAKDEAKSDSFVVDDTVQEVTLNGDRSPNENGEHKLEASQEVGFSISLLDAAPVYFHLSLCLFTILG
ncbi:hypothetical protein SprV_0100456800 [Sparganum proliferum]